MEPKCKQKREVKLTGAYWHHSWSRSVVNGVETGLCGICGLVRMRPKRDEIYASASADYPFFYYKPIKTPKAW